MERQPAERRGFASASCGWSLAGHRRRLRRRGPRHPPGGHASRPEQQPGSLEVHVFSPRLVNEARFGFHRYRLDVIAHAFRQNLAEKFGLKGVNTGELFSGLPAIYLNAYNNIGTDDFKPLYFRETSIQFNDT